MTKFLREMTDEEIKSLNAEMAEQILDEVKETLEALGVDMAAVPPMFYPEAIGSAVSKTKRDILSKAKELAVSDTDRGFVERLEEAVNPTGLLDALRASLGLRPHREATPAKGPTRHRWSASGACERCGIERAGLVAPLPACVPPPLITPKPA